MRLIFMDNSRPLLLLLVLKNCCVSFLNGELYGDHKFESSVCTVLFFGAEIQPKHLVFCYLGFLPCFSLVFCFLPHPYARLFLTKPSFLALADFFPCFFKSKRLLGFLGVVYMLKSGPNGILLFLILSMLNIQNISEI
jgi:hypothetical protein